MSLIRRHTPLVCVLLAIAALVVPTLFQRADASTPAVATAIAGPDYATTIYGDPWDMSNAADINLDPLGSTLYVTNQSLSGGAAHFSAAKVSYVSLLWPGVPGSLPWGRDGRLPANRIPAASYPRFHAHLYASSGITVWIQWAESCANCTGYYPVALAAGWNDVDVALTGSNAVGTPWSGSVTMLRLQMMTSRATNLAIDFARVYRPIPAGVVSWSAPTGRPSTLRWSDTGSFVAGDGTDSGTVPGASSSGSATATDLSGYAPGTTLFAYDGTTATKVAVVATEPLPVVDSPSSAGCAGPIWRFTSSRSNAGVFNAINIAYTTSGVLSATNGGAHPNDPNVLMPLASTGFDGRLYHRMTVVESYDGGFNLANAPGGGTMGRILWREPGHTALSQTPPLVTPTGRQSIQLDMAQPTSVITEPQGTAAMRYAFASTSPVTTLRWDPNEDPGARRWHLYSVRIAADCSTKTAYSIVWHDNAYVPGSLATIVARSPGGHTRTLATDVPELSGSNTLRVIGRTIGAGTWMIRVQVTAPSGASHLSQNGPLVVG